MTLYKPLTGRIVLAVTDPDVSTTTINAVSLSARSRIVERGDVLAAPTNTGNVRIGCENIRGELTEARGELLTAGERYTLPRTDLAWWFITGDTAGDVVTWSAEQEVVSDGRPINS